jgi:hypothetical protein
MSEKNQGGPLAASKAEGDLKSRVEALEAQNALLIEGLRWAADQIRPMFGQGALAVIFEGVADGLAKPKKGKK